MAFRILKSDAVLKRVAPTLTQAIAVAASTAVEASLDQPANLKHSFRTAEDNPVNHCRQHEALYYTIEASVKAQLFQHGGLPKMFERQVKTFQETSLMVRDPALQVIRFLKSADYTQPAIRYVLYGRPGCGKSLSLAHILHFGHETGCILIHVPWVANWMRRCKEMCNSQTREGFVDLPMDSASWLLHFKTQNAQLLNQLDLRVGREYVWSKREETKEGAPLLELVELGINRVKYASECVVAITSEVKRLSTMGRCKTLVVIDGFNAFFNEKTKVRTEEKVFVPASRVTLTEAFMGITKFDWCNGAIVLSVDELAVPAECRESALPVYLLGKQGFEHLDPFVPVRVAEYGPRELKSCLAFYEERHWLGENSPAAEDELGFIAGNNPFSLMNLCASL